MNLYLFKFLLYLFPLFVHADINWEEITERIYQTPDAFNLTPIGQGCTNSNYRLQLNDAYYFVRIAPSSAIELGASMEIEYEVLQALYGLHISPQPLFLNSNRQIMVTEFISNAHEADLSDPSTRQQAFTLLHQIEESGIFLTRTYQPYEDILHLVDLAQFYHDPICEKLIREVLPAIKIIEQKLSSDTLSHFDLHHGNILTDGTQVWFIDWEYATMADRFLSLASMSSTENWNDEQMKIALAEYLPSFIEQDYHALFLNRIVIDLHWAAWCHLQKYISPLEMPFEQMGNAYLEEALARIQSL